MTQEEALSAAENIVDDFSVGDFGFDRKKMAKAIAQAILDAEKRERERCAKIASEYICTLTGDDIAEAIRKGE